MGHVSQEVEALQLTTDELLKRMPKEQAINLVQNVLRTMEESMNVPDIPAAKIRMEKVLEELKRSWATNLGISMGTGYFPDSDWRGFHAATWLV